MRYFTDYKLPKDKHYGIVNLLSNCPVKKDSHKGGWTRLLKCQLENAGYSNVEIITGKTQLKTCDGLIFDFGAEFKGGLNLFGGLTVEMFHRILELVNFTGPIFSWQHIPPNVDSLIARLDNNSTAREFRQVDSHRLLKKLGEVLDSVRVFNHVEHKDILHFCDSHGPGMWCPDWLIERRDGRSLIQAVEYQSFSKYGQVDEFKHVILQLGSIDIRHHLGDHFSPAKTLRSYMSQMEKMVKNTGLTFEWAETIGIEDESRSIPKTGWFNGMPYNGSWYMRNGLRLYYNDLCKRYRYPDYFYDKEGKLKFDVMEKPGSVHISPEHYRWNLDNNTKRWLE